MPGIISSRTRRLYRRPPGPPYVLNRDSPQARGLVAWWPLGEPNVSGYQDYASGKYPLTPGAATAAPTVAAGPPDGGLAASFASASSQYLEYAGAVVAAAPWSLSAWFKPVANNVIYTLLSVANNTVANQRGNLQAGVSAGLVTLTVQNGATSSGPNTTTSFTAGTWNLASCSQYSATSRAVWCNAGGKATATTNIDLNAPNRTRVSSQPINTPSQFMNGLIADARVYAVGLTDDEWWAVYDPRTRWELYYPLGRKTWSFAPAGAATALPWPASGWGAAAPAAGTGDAAAAPGAARSVGAAVNPAAGISVTAAPAPAAGWGAAAVAVASGAAAGRPAPAAGWGSCVTAAASGTAAAAPAPAAGWGSCLDARASGAGAATPGPSVGWAVAGPVAATGAAAGPACPRRRRAGAPA